MQEAVSFFEVNKQRFLDELLELLRIPSISAAQQYRQACIDCAEHIKRKLLEAGVDHAQIYDTEGLPLVYGEKIIDHHRPTVLIYGHYDVQPVDPIDLWETPPFEPTIKENKIYARGSADDKGQVFMHIKAFESLLKTDQLPVNIKFLIEGEEEVGSIHLEQFVQNHKTLLASDVILVSDTAMLSMENPSIDVGLRGLSYLEIELTGPNRDLHSGVYGGAVANPITILCQMLATLHDKDHRITVPQFYKHVMDLTPEERSQIQRIPFDLKAFMSDLNIAQDWGEKGFSVIERTGTRPTLEINGIWGGYIEEGAKTVLPSKAYAKISCRLVPHQTSPAITTLLSEYLRSITPKNMCIKITPMHGGNPYVISPQDPAYIAAVKAIEKTFHKTPIPVRGGGSIPIIPHFEQHLNVKTVLLGFGLNDDNLHSPNEKFNIENFYKGIETIIYFHYYFSQIKTWQILP